MTLGQWLAHLEDVMPSWYVALVIIVGWTVLALLTARLGVWLVRRSWPMCIGCGERVHPEDLHICCGRAR